MHSDPPQPAHDSLPCSPVDWTDVPLGAGQEPSPRAKLQFTKQGDPLRSTDVRRTEGYEHLYVVHRPPNAPA